jgi:hypothetical protein
MSDVSPSNRHAADALADTRRMIKELEARELALRSSLLANPHSRGGDEFYAIVCASERRSVNMQSLADEVGAEVMARHARTHAFNAVRLVAVRGSIGAKDGLPLRLGRPRSGFSARNAAASARFETFANRFRGGCNESSLKSRVGAALSAAIP